LGKLEGAAQRGLDMPLRIGEGEAARGVRGEGLGKGGFGRLRGDLAVLRSSEDNRRRCRPLLGHLSVARTSTAIDSPFTLAYNARIQLKVLSPI